MLLPNIVLDLRYSTSFLKQTKVRHTEQEMGGAQNATSAQRYGRYFAI